METETKRLRLSLTLPGSASLGAYQAGATAALAVAIRTMRSRSIEVDVDAVGGASAGSFVATLFTHCLLTGRDATDLLMAAWIDGVDIDLLRSGGPDSPLATDQLRDKIENFLDDRTAFPYGANQPLAQPVTLQIGLTSLLGFTAPVESTSGASLSGLSYSDWAEFELRPEHHHRELSEKPPTPEQGLSVLDTVLASATHPAGFLPHLLDRSADRQVYLDRGVSNFPDDGKLWYIDGGLVESFPVARVIQAANRRAADRYDGRRVHLVIDPRSSAPTRSWSTTGADPSWLDGLRRSVSIVPTQALHDDLRRVASVNLRLARLDEAVERLANRLEEAGEPVDRDQLRSELAAIGELDGKVRVDIDMISPLLLVDDDGGDEQGDAVDLLAGDFIGAFGGFLDADIRRSDFALGWAATDRWCRRGLGGLGIADDISRAVVEELRAARPEGLSEDAILSGAGEDHLSRSGRWQLTLLAAQYGRVLIQSALPGVGSLVDRWRR